MHFPISKCFLTLSGHKSQSSMYTENHSLARGAETHTLQTSMGMDTLPAVPSGGYLLFMGPVTLNGQEKEMKPRHKGIKIRAGS